MNDDDPLLSRALALALQHHGIGGPSAQPPAWLRARIGASLLELAAESGTTPAQIVSRLERDATLRAELGEVLRVGETRFFRDAAQWQALRQRLLPRLSGSRLRALSAGCSTGEEAWTLAMLLDEAAGERPLRVVGLDKSRVALAAARAASYAKESARELPADLAQRYLEATADGGLRVRASLQSRVSFTPRDLLQGAAPGEFDLVVCKNVLIYLAEDAGQRVLGVLSTALAEHGVLLVARSEIPRARSFGLQADEIEPGVVVFRRRTPP
jgi:chemotaxis protein methyltransferase CheR